MALKDRRFPAGPYVRTVDGNPPDANGDASSSGGGGGGGAPAAHHTTHESGGSDAVTLAQSQITGLVSDLAAKAPLASPALTGNPTAPTPTAGDNDTSIATTAFVTSAVAAAVTPPKKREVVIPTAGPPAASSGVWTNVYGTVALGGWFQSAGAQNNSATWEVQVGPGTWALDVTFYRDTNRGIETWEIDDGAGNFTTLGTLDQYGAAGTSLVHTLTGLTVTGSAVNRKLRVTAATKNASSSAYYLLIHAIQLRQT